MQKLPYGLPPIDCFYSQWRAGLCAHVTLAAARLGIFERLQEKQSLHELNRKLRYDQDALACLLELLIAMGLLHREGDAYGNTPVGNALLNRKAPFAVIDMLEKMRTMLVEPMRNMEEIVKNGPAMTGGAAAGENVWADEVKSGAEWAFHGPGERLAGILSSLPGMSGASDMLDLGCGHGIFSLYTAALLPDLGITLFDRAPVLAAAREHMRDFGFSERIRELPGDYLHDDIGCGYDLVLASCTLNFALLENRLEQVMAKIYSSLKPGGYFVSLHDSWSGAAKETPGSEIDHLAFGVLLGRNLLFRENQIAETAFTVGFKHVQSRRFASGIGGYFDLDIARKG